MIAELSPKNNNDRNYEIGSENEVYISHGVSHTVSAGMFLETPQNVLRKQGIDARANLKLAIDSPKDDGSRSDYLVFDTAPEVSEGQPGHLFMVAKDDLVLEDGPGVSHDEVMRAAQWIPADGAEVSGSDGAFRIKSNERGDVIVIGSSEEQSVLLRVPG